MSGWDWPAGTWAWDQNCRAVTARGWGPRQSHGPFPTRPCPWNWCPSQGYAGSGLQLCPGPRPTLSPRRDPDLLLDATPCPPAAPSHLPGGGPWRPCLPGLFIRCPWQWVLCSLAAAAGLSESPLWGYREAECGHCDTLALPYTQGCRDQLHVP